MTTSMDSRYEAKQDIQAAQYRSAYHWDSDKPVESHRYERMTRLLLDQITGRLDAPAARVLDFGCGDGRSTFLIWQGLRTTGIACQVVGIDVSSDAIRWASERTADAADASLRFTAGQLEDGLDQLGGIEGPLFVVMREVLEHLPQGEIDRVLGVVAARSPAATLIVSVPSSNSPVEDKHFRHYDAASLRETLEGNGYACERVIGFGFRPALLYRPLRKLKSRLNRTRRLWRAFNWLWRSYPPRVALTLVAVGAPRRG